MPKTGAAGCITKRFVRVPDAEGVETALAARAAAKAKKNVRLIAKSIQQNAV